MTPSRGDPPYGLTREAFGGAPDLPQIVFAPAHPQAGGGQGDVVFEIRQLADGRRMLPVFTTTEKLVAALGPQQPWAALPLSAAQALMGAAGVDQIVLDPDADADAWRWRPGDLDELRRRMG